MSRFHPLLLRAAFKHLEILAEYRRNGLSKKRPFEELGNLSPTHFVGSERFPTDERTQAVLLDPVTTASKAERVYRALIDQGLSKSAIALPRPANLTERITTSVRARCYDKALQGKHLTSYQRAFVTACLIYRDIFRETRGLTIHIGDLSERRLAMTVGAAMAGAPAAHWQLYQHFRTIPQLGYTHAIVLSDPAAKSAEQQGLDVYRQVLSAPSAMRLPSEIRSVGICLNAFGTPEQVSDLCETLRARASVDMILLRPHPRIEKFDTSKLPDIVSLRPHGESLNDFANACDIVLCGSSSVQVELLALGCPVIHVAGLDSQPYDYLGLCAGGIAFGLEKIELFDLDAVKAFYSQPNWQTRLLSTLEPPATSLPLVSSLWSDAQKRSDGQP
ncbi:hypothetical protein HJ526_05950 [Donghicola sp. C2-DW-16]|uniref:Uncharacterized protein n=1 Tax=Donghicola mangrovi TaxID=2729614 RepID=A0ABX2PBV5_9RHOB|nr:hypothetical protein [Donghicola mangrovi]NVO26953.1 hypothetical protein [Donghicola mangrovi]